MLEFILGIAMCATALLLLIVIHTLCYLLAEKYICAERVERDLKPKRVVMYV